MKIPFLQHLPGRWGLLPVRQVVASSQGEAEATVLRHLLAELPDLLLAAVLDLTTGQLLASYAAEADYQPARPAAAAAALRQLEAGLAAQPQSGEELQELLLTLPTQLHLLRRLPGGQRFLYLVVEVRDTNLALARQLMQQAAEQLNEIL